MGEPRSDVEKQESLAHCKPRHKTRQGWQPEKDFILSLDADKREKNSLTHDFFAQMMRQKA
jgi:hypothetical protein